MRTAIGQFSFALVVLKIFTAEEGGAEHCQVDNRPLGIDYVGDWILANT